MGLGKVNAGGDGARNEGSRGPSWKLVCGHGKGGAIA